MPEFGHGNNQGRRSCDAWWEQILFPNQLRTASKARAGGPEPATTRFGGEEFVLLEPSFVHTFEVGIDQLGEDVLVERSPPTISECAVDNTLKVRAVGNDATSVIHDLPNDETMKGMQAMRLNATRTAIHAIKNMCKACQNIPAIQS